MRKLMKRNKSTKMRGRKDTRGHFPSAYIYCCAVYVSGAGRRTGLEGDQSETDRVDDGTGSPQAVAVELFCHLMLNAIAATFYKTFF